MATSESDISAVDESASSEPAADQAVLAAAGSKSVDVAPDPAVLALCVPISDTDPCGPDLDGEGDIDYLNFLAGAEGVLPTSFFSQEDGRPFDRALIDFDRQLEALKPLLARTADLRLLIVRARLLILNRDLAGFAVSLAAAAEWLEKYWDQVHPRPQDGDLTSRAGVIATLDLPTVVFPLQYAPLFEARRLGQVTYRGLMIATDEAKPRTGEVRQSATAFSEALNEAPPEAIAEARKNVATVKTSLDRISNAFAMHGEAAGLETLPALVIKIAKFIDPTGVVIESAPGEAAAEADGAKAAAAAGPGLASVGHARAALAAVAQYYSTSEPSSPILPLVRQAHELIGKSFFDVMTALVPTQVETAVFQIGNDSPFDLPVGRLSGFGEVTPTDFPPNSDGSVEPPAYVVTSRGQAIGLMDQVQRFYRQSEPSSPIPMLCERARALAERDFMGVLREVLPKTAFRVPETGG